jgi:hypothetical protein
MTDYMQNYRSEMDAWQEMWDEAQEKGIHPEQEPVQPREDVPDTGKAQDYYYNYLDDALAEPPEVLTEEKKVTTPNPVYPDSAGPDCATTPPVWVSEDIVKEIQTLKDKLFDVENKIAEMGGGKKWAEKAQFEQDKAMSEIDSLKKRIEELSSTLGTEHEKSPWVVKRD